jgi:hypothetical protein
MKKYTNSLLVLLILLTLSTIYVSCNEDTNPTTTPTTTVTSIQANGTVQQVSRTQTTGTLIVVDQNGAPISGLTNSNVKAYLRWPAKMADSVSGAVTVSSNTGSGKNVSGAVTMDYSGSMGSAQIQCMEDGVKTYINAMGSNDITEIIKFDDQVVVAQPFTSNKTLLINAVDSNFSLGGSTALYQSIYKGTTDVIPVSSSQYIRSVIAFTDGGENASSVSRATMISTALSNAIPIYSIFLYSDTSNSLAKDMRNIADTTGGFFFWAKPDATCSSSLSGVYNTIKGQISGSYTMDVVWPSGPLPPTGTLVRVTFYIEYSGLKTSFTKTYNIL